MICKKKKSQNLAIVNAEACFDCKVNWLAHMHIQTMSYIVYLELFAPQIIIVGNSDPMQVAPRIFPYLVGEKSIVHGKGNFRGYRNGWREVHEPEQIKLLDSGQWQ